MSKKKFKKEKEKKNRKEQDSLFNTLLALLDEMNGKAYSVQQIVKKLGVKKKSMIEEIFKMLDALEEEGAVEVLSNGFYKPTSKGVGGGSGGEGITGLVDHVNPRFAYIVTGETGVKDIYVRTTDLGSAMHGDTVKVAMLGRKTGESPREEWWRL
jgi:Exoribonuclease R